MQPQRPRIQNNPYLVDCPDFSDKAFEEQVVAMVGPDRTREQVIVNLRASWHVLNDRRKALWNAQLLADQECCEDPGQVQGDNEAAIARRQPKLEGFTLTASIANEVFSKPSTYAINKLRDMKYIELYCFTPAGCRDLTKQKLTTTDKAFSFTYSTIPDGLSNNSLTLKSISALSHPGKIIPDEDLT